MKHILLSLSLLVFSSVTFAQSEPQVAVVQSLATRLKIHANLPTPTPLPIPGSEAATVALEDVKIEEGGALIQYTVVFTTYVQSHTCDIGKIESVHLVIERTGEGQKLSAIGTGPARKGGCPEYYSMKKTKIVFSSGIYFDEQDQTTMSDVYVIDNSGVKIVITAVRGGEVSAKLEKIAVAKP